MQDRLNTEGERFNDLTDMRASSQRRSFSQILQEMLDHVTEIVRSEVRLAQTEIRQNIKEFSRAGTFLVIGAVFGLYAVGFILLGVVYALETRMAPWLSSILVGVGTLIVAAVFLQVGRGKMKQSSLQPDETIRSLQENLTWMKEQTK